MSSSSRTRCRPISLHQIRDATNNFDERKVIGKGGEGTVYLADLYIGQNKTRVAVKHLKPNSTEFENEIQTMPKIQHPNIVSLLGYCKESGQKILVYEYMLNGSLSKYVKERSSTSTSTSTISLSWALRLKICLGAARGLQCLHTETPEFPKGIIHRDVKPDNILLDEKWVGKISDFGMFKLSHCGQTKSFLTTNIKGTQGYYAPEYLTHHSVSRKIDVYAFGVVLFQVLCRKTPWDRGGESYYRTDDEDLGLWAQQNVDASIRREISQDCLMVFTDIIRRSLQTDPHKRPTMDGVVVDLEKALKCQNLEDEAKRSREDPTTHFHPEDPTPSFQNLCVRQCPKVEDDRHKDHIPNKKDGDILFRRKCPPGGENKVLLYTGDDDESETKACTQVKNVLQVYDADFEERSIRIPLFRRDLQRLVNNVNCPRLFVRGMDIGGVAKVGELHASQKLGSILQHGG